MKQFVKSSDFKQCLERFYEFADAEIRSITIRFDKDGTRSIDISVSARDSMAQESDDWVCITLSIDLVLEMAVQEHFHTTIQVLNQGIHISMFDGKVGIEFGGEVDSPETLAELRKSNAFAVGDTLSIEVHPY